MNRRKFDWKTFRWFLLFGSAISLAAMWVSLSSYSWVGFHRWARYGWPIGLMIDGIPNFVESLVVFFPNALIWTLALYVPYRLGKWVESRSGSAGS